MREILFRGKLTANSEWSYGCLKIFHDKTCAISPDDTVVGKYGRVDHATVGQYTGLTDKNGVKIFEGDILSGSMYPFTHDGNRNYYAVVVWFENSPSFGIETVKAPGSSVSGISAGNTDYMEDWDTQCWEVIGNIHDNPELLKEEAEDG